MLLGKKKRIHFVGIGGIGMSGLAGVLLKMGHKVSGSDLKPNSLTQRIESSGGRIFKGHRASNVSRDVDLVVYSSSITKDNPEIIEAERRGITVAHRAKMVGELLNTKKGIAVAGTHGKTTTTALISVMLENCGFDPTVLIGGEVKEFRGNAKAGKSGYLVAEADESDSSFLNLRPFYSVITNIEMEHLDHYKTFEDILSSYRAFLKVTKKNGNIFYNYDDRNVRDLVNGLSRKRPKAMSFGYSEDADIYPINIKMDEFRTSFKCVYKNRVQGDIDLKIPGRHNVANALAAVLVGLALGLDFKRIAGSIRGFDGAKRRFHLRANVDGVMLIDDYAHHPTEIRAVLAACRNWKYNRLIVIFQPHRYTRTLFLADEFGRCFKEADVLILADIYAASEKPIEGVSVKNIYDKAITAGMKNVSIMDKGSIAGYIMKMKRRGDMVLVLGAGDICEVADELSERLRGNFGKSNKDDIIRLKSLVKGKLRFMEDISPHTSFRIGGPADIWAEPKDAKELKKVLRFAKSERLKIFIIGRGTNLLVKDSGFKGLVIHLGSPHFKKIKIEGTRLVVGAGFGMPQLVALCCDRSLGGLESLVGIPGTVGGAVYMNAGGSANPVFRNIGEFVTSLKVMDYSGNIKNLAKGSLRFGYRRSNLEDCIILEVRLKLHKEDSSLLNSRAIKFLKMKRTKQVLDIPSAGCIFKNPEDFQFTCGQMIDMLGLKGQRKGGAEISRKHANFIVNKDRATYEDVLGLIDIVKERVLENYNIPLELEIGII